MRVIYINTRFHYSRELMEMKEDNKYFYLYGMGHILGWKILKKYPDVKIENWRADKTVTEVKEKFVDGIYCRIFPSERVNKYGEFSKELKNKLISECKDKDTIVHFMGTHSIPYFYYINALKKVPAVMTHLGGANPLWKYKRDKKIKSYITHLAEKYYFSKKYNFAFAFPLVEGNYFRSFLGKKNVSDIPIFGVNMSDFQIKDKAEAKKKLGFPLDKKIILQVGRAVKLRGVDILLDVWKKIKNDNLYLYMVDIHPEDELYDNVVKSGVPFEGQVFYYDLIDYYNAADVLIYIPWGEVSLNFAGTSYVPLEALACGTPVIATTLVHFPEDYNGTIYYIPKSKEDIINSINLLLNKPPEREKCREAVQKHFNWDLIVNEYIKVYTKLLKRKYA